MSKQYQFKGNLRGFFCDHCSEQISGVVIRLYKPQADQRIIELAVADPKETFRELTTEAINAKQSLLLAEAKTNEVGEFIIDLPPTHYDGGAFEIDFMTDDVPYHFPPKHRQNVQVQFTITILQPQWREAADSARLTANWAYAIPSKWWCAIRARFGAYVVCGQVVDCATQTPLAGLKVSAFDVDLIQDDPLGSAITDSTGHYKLYYSEAAFSKTIFNWLNVEWPAGPDLYFKIETGSGDVLLQEPRSQGHTPGRENAPNCLCVNFCVKNPGRPNTYVPALFTHVGQYAIASDFDAQGFTIDAQNNAFTGNLDLIGILPGAIASNTMEYRFKAKNLATSAEVIVDANYLNPFRIGTLTTYTGGIPPYDSVPYMVNSAGAPHNVVVDPQGWIRIPRDNALFTTGQFSAGTLLGSLDTLALLEQGFNIHERYTAAAAAAFDLTTPAVYVAGQPFPATSQAGVHTFQLTFEAREVGSSTLAYSITLPKIVLTNVTYLQRVHPSWAGGDRQKTGVGMLEIAQTTATGEGCNKIVDVLTANYSVVHPFLETMSLTFEGNAPLPAHFSVSLLGLNKKIGSETFDTSAMQPCAYIISLVAHLRLTSGYGRRSDAYVDDHIAFCKA
ncbi:hypothetical protein ACAW74_03745 [Fibrella sp. WM1]|uniref:hypothetical protein n=1 Tax=Fibrella musci TaxID=3242485 RepID=UPI0035214C18